MCKFYIKPFLRIKAKAFKVILKTEVVWRVRRHESLLRSIKKAMGERGNGKGQGRAESGTKRNSGKFSTSIARFASDTRYEQKSARLGTFFFGRILFLL